MCRSCNNGWISRLENEAKPLHRPMLTTNLSMELSESSQAILAKWAIKTAMMVQYLMPPESDVIPPQTYADFFRAQAPLPSTTVHGALYEGVVFAGFHAVGVSFSQPDGRGYGLTYHIHRLAIQIFGHTLPESMTAEVGTAVATYAVRLWPAVPQVRWPPARTLDQPSLDRFRHSFEGMTIGPR